MPIDNSVVLHDDEKFSFAKFSQNGFKMDDPHRPLSVPTVVIAGACLSTEQHH